MRNGHSEVLALPRSIYWKTAGRVIWTVWSCWTDWLELNLGYDMGACVDVTVAESEALTTKHQMAGVGKGLYRRC